MRAILILVAGVALVIALAFAIPVPSHAATVPAPPATAPAAPAEPNTFALPQGAPMPPDSDVITPFDCGSGFCVLPKAGMVNVFRVMNLKDQAITALELEVVRLRGELKDAGPRRCGKLERTS